MLAQTSLRAATSRGRGLTGMLAAAGRSSPADLHSAGLGAAGRHAASQAPGPSPAAPHRRAAAPSLPAGALSRRRCPPDAQAARAGQCCTLQLWVMTRRQGAAAAAQAPALASSGLRCCAAAGLPGRVHRPERGPLRNQRWAAQPTWLSGCPLSCASCAVPVPPTSPAASPAGQACWHVQCGA